MRCSKSLTTQPGLQKALRLSPQRSFNNGVAVSVTKHASKTHRQNALKTGRITVAGVTMPTLAQAPCQRGRVYRSLIGETRNGASRNPRARRCVQTVALLHDAHDNGAIAAIDCAVVALLNSACRQEKARSNARDGGGAGA
ncbi:hypothetical protein [Xanthomonas sp. fls2-241-TYG-148]|uniref:hypothetical protein n=1 Tax=Xanthomonas sp. fls2-241-TYG-148 TaxID=3040328 RepID=UPI00255215A7|nr:hypothetical protein [Xanthomonas sp. fls2-241-TYG-148]